MYWFFFYSRYDGGLQPEDHTSAETSFNDIAAGEKAALLNEKTLSHFGNEETTTAECLKLKWLYNEVYHTKNEIENSDMTTKQDEMSLVKHISIFNGKVYCAITLVLTLGPSFRFPFSISKWFIVRLVRLNWIKINRIDRIVGWIKFAVFFK